MSIESWFLLVKKNFLGYIQIPYTPAKWDSERT